MYKIIALWSHPRSLSTVMERVFLERGDMEVFHEPFSYLYYFYDKIRDISYTSTAFNSNHPLSYADISEMLRNASARSIVFHKDMCFHCNSYIFNDLDFIYERVNTFIIRHPRKSIRSYAAICPRFEIEQLGYKELYKTFNFIKQLLGHPPIVIDADDLESHPETVLNNYCIQIGVDPSLNSTSWSSGMPHQWRIWTKWHEKVAQGGSIRGGTNNYSDDIIDASRLNNYSDQLLPFYSEIVKYKMPIN